MFLGRFSHNLDTKGRLAIPSRFRDEFGADVVITRGFDRCLSLYSIQTFQPLAEKVAALSISDPDARTFRRMVFAEAAGAEFDKQGRILIPPELRQYAGLDREAIVIGMNTYVEIWNPTAWELQAQLMDEEGASIAQRLAAII